MLNTLKILLRNRIKLKLVSSQPSNFKMKGFLSIILLFISFSSISQGSYDYPVVGKKVDSLKKNEPKLWYVDKSLSEIEKIEMEKEPKQERKQQKQTQQKTEKEPQPSFIGQVFSLIIWVIVGGAILFAIYLIFVNLKDFKFKRNEKVETISEVIDEKSITNQNIGLVGFQAQVDKSIREGNYRLAIRYYYLWIVKNLNDAHLIEFNIDKTNQEYLKELKGKTMFSTDRLAQFKNCTLFYEYVWFGNFEINQTAFQKIETTFKEFINER